jgi:hypothetical protein
MRELKSRRCAETTCAAGSRACGEEALEAQLVRQAPHWCLSLWHCSGSELNVLGLRGLQGTRRCFAKRVWVAMGRNLGEKLGDIPS